MYSKTWIWERYSLLWSCRALYGADSSCTKLGCGESEQAKFKMKIILAPFLYFYLFIYLFYFWEGNTDSKLARGTDAWRKVFCHLNFTNLELRGLLLLLSLRSQDILCSNYRFLISAQELQNEIVWVLSGRMLLQYTMGRRREGRQQENVGQIQGSRC